MYFPVQFPRFTFNELAAFSRLPYHEIAFRVLSRFTEGIVTPAELAKFCQDAYNFPVPLEVVNFRTFLMRLDQGRPRPSRISRRR